MHLNRPGGVHGQRVAGDGVLAWMVELADRLRHVRVCCGDWTRVCGPTPTVHQGLTAVFLDPPYSHAERDICYSHDEDIGADVRTWALDHGDDPQLRIALCGYDGKHQMPASWECVTWKATGGYARSGGRGETNSHRERIWFSPHCLAGRQGALPLDVR